VLGADLNAGDYDRRTPLHLAASNGQLETISYLVKQCVEMNPRDRWSATPLDDAADQDVEYMLIKNGAVNGEKSSSYQASTQIVVTDE